MAGHWQGGGRLQSGQSHGNPKVVKREPLALSASHSPVLIARRNSVLNDRRHAPWNILTKTLKRFNFRTHAVSVVHWEIERGTRRAKEVDGEGESGTHLDRGAKGFRVADGRHGLGTATETSRRSGLYNGK